MALISGTISNLFSGVSQQAPALRLPTQAEEMDNFYPSLVDGLVKRPPVRDHVSIATDDAKRKGGKLHIINRDPTHQYVVVFHDNKLAVYTTASTRLFEATPAYLSGADPQQIGFLTVADHTFVINKTKTVDVIYQMGGGGPKGAIVSVKQASYDTTYMLSVRGAGLSTSLAVATTPKNYAVDEPPPSISTIQIASDLATKLREHTDFTNNFSVEHSGSTLYINSLKSMEFNCQVTDSRGDTHIYVARGSVQKFANLPSIAIRDFTVEVQGDESSAFDNFYVKFVPNDPNTNFGPGTWVETRKPVPQFPIFNPDTMPHALVHTNGKFEFKKMEWAVREVGDDKSAPDPLFMNAKISDMFLYRNRLGILSDDNLTLSAASDFFRFYPETVTTIVDSDPISLSAGHETVTLLKHAIPFQENLVVFSENAQFNMPTTDTLSPQTAALKISTTFEADLTVKPVTTGQTVAFCVRNGGFTGLREFYMDNDTLTRMTGNLTAHVPTYVPGDPTALACSTTEDVLVIVSKRERHKLYVYKYYWSGNEKLQAAWFTFSLPKSAHILDLTFLESRLFMLVNRNGDVCIAGMDLAVEHLTENSNPIKTTLFLDRQSDLMPGRYDEATDTTTWRPAPRTSPDERVCVVDTQTLKTVECAVDPATYAVSARGRHTFATPALGVLYDSTYTFSEQFLRSDDGSGNRIATQLGRLQFRRWSLIYGPSCFFKVRTEQNGTVYEYPFTGEFVNRPGSFLARPALFKGKFSFPVKSISDRVRITITNDTCLPCSIIGAEWEAFYTQRQRGRF